MRTSLLSLTKQTPLAILITQGQCHLESLGIPAGWHLPLSRFTTLQAKDPWQIATG